MSGLCKLGLQQIIIKVEKLNPRIIIDGCTCLLLNLLPCLNLLSGVNLMMIDMIALNKFTEALVMNIMYSSQKSYAIKYCQIMGNRYI